MSTRLERVVHHQGKLYTFFLRRLSLRLCFRPILNESGEAVMITLLGIYPRI